MRIKIGMLFASICNHLITCSSSHCSEKPCAGIGFTAKQICYRILGRPRLLQCSRESTNFAENQFHVHGMGEMEFAVQIHFLKQVDSLLPLIKWDSYLCLVTKKGNQNQLI